MRVLDTIRDYLQLTKPSIMLLVLVTGASGLIMAPVLPGHPQGWGAWFLVLVGLFCTGGSANALNQYFEREIDAQMTRTKKRRPLPMGRISAWHALTFAIVIGALGVALFAWQFNLLSAGLALGTILFYGLLYTLILKPNTVQNIVIGGAAGAMAPVIAWAAMTGQWQVASPWLLFLIIFLWTPPHFWALALYLQDDYKLVKLPMMPVVRGEAATMKQMWWYTLLLVASSLALSLVPNGTGIVYFVVALVLGAVFIQKMWVLLKSPSRQLQRGLFKYSIIYLLALFAVMIAEGLTGLEQFSFVVR